MATARHITKDKGDLAVAKTIAHLRENGIYTCLPLSEHLPFDLIAVMPDMQTLRRVQVKYRADMGVGAVNLRFRSNYYDSKRIYSKPVDLAEIDCYAVYCADKSEIYYMRVDEIPENGKSVTLRFEPTKSGRQIDVWMAHNFIDPLRIAPPSKKASLTGRKMSPMDEIALGFVMADLMEKGVQPLIPQSQYVPFDLVGILPDMKTMQRVRVGYGHVNLSLCIDQYAVYLPDQGIVRYFSPGEIQESQRFIATAG